MELPALLVWNMAKREPEMDEVMVPVAKARTAAYEEAVSDSEENDVLGAGSSTDATIPFRSPSIRMFQARERQEGRALVLPSLAAVLAYGTRRGLQVLHS